MDLFGLSLLLLALLVIGGLIGYGTFKVSPVVGVVGGVVSVLLIAGILFSAIGIGGGLLAWLSGGWVKYVTTFVVGWIIGIAVSMVF